MTRDQIVAQARTWLGTPWHHQARKKGVGVDCVGLVVGVCQELGLAVDDFTDYSRFPDGVTLGAEMGRQLVKKAGPVLPGDVLLFRISRLPQHVGFATDRGVLHAHQGAKSVVETVLPESWSRRLIGIFEIPGVQ